MTFQRKVGDQPAVNTAKKPEEIKQEEFGDI